MVSMQYIRAKGKRTLRRRNPPQRVYLQLHAALSQRLRRCRWVWFYRLLQPSWCRIGCFGMFGKTVSSSTVLVLCTYEWSKNSLCTGYIGLYRICHARAHARISLAVWPDPFPQRRSLSACSISNSRAWERASISRKICHARRNPFWVRRMCRSALPARFCSQWQWWRKKMLKQISLVSL